jgi:nucleotide-binding universal stress UspA family protein
MLKRILIGVDAIDRDSAAMELGLRWAKRHGARVVGIGVVDESGIEITESLMYPRGYVASLTPTLVSEIHSEFQLNLKRFTERCAAEGVACGTLEAVGPPHATILAEAQRHDLMLLDRGSHFEFGWEGEPGQTLARLMKDSPRPIVAAPEALPDGEAIVVSYDGSLQASRALFAFVNLGLADGRPVHVVTVATEQAEADRVAGRARDYLESHDVPATLHAFESAQHPAGILLEQVIRLEAGLVVMGAYGRRTLRECFVGSVTRGVLNESPAPIFCFH